ncbi:flagellin [Clostridiaceae bacterium]|nr:flagellin [Clostridiaceae bacterium]
MTIAGKTVAVTGATLDEQLKEFADAWNADTTVNANWSASVGTGDDAGKIVFTAKTAGAIDGDGPAAANAPTGTTQKDPGADAVEADDKFTVKLNNVEIAKDVALEADDTAETIAGKVFTELGGTAGAALNGVDLFGDGTLYTVEQDGTKLKFTLESTPTADNIKGNFDWDIESDTVFAGNHTAGTNVITPGSVESAGVRANTVFEIKDTDLVDGAKITIDGKTVTLSVGVNSTVKAGAGVVSLTDAEAADLHLALGKISEGFGGGTTNFEVSVNNGANGDAKTGLAVYKKADSKESYTTKADLEAVFSLSTPGKGEGKALTLQIGDTSDSYNQLNVSVKDMHCDSLGIDKIDISNPDGAAAAINTIRNAINTVSSVRGNLGAISNRLDHTSNNLSVMRENIQDAESTIRDTDIAEEMMSYTKNNILVQSAQAMLAQANQVPQGVLQLLQ